MYKNEQLVSIDLGSLSSVTGGWNPFKRAWNEVKDEAKQVRDNVVRTTAEGVEYVKQHPEILIQ
jgi:hypothetical protein